MQPLKTRNAKFLSIFSLFGIALIYFAFVLLGKNVLYPAFGDDQSIYLVCAKALAAGNGYRLINFPAAPQATLYPAGYSALLVPFVSVSNSFPALVLLSRLFSTFCCLIFLFVSYKLLCYFMASRVAGLTTAVIGLAPSVFTASGSILSDPPFQVLLLFGLLLLAKTSVLPEKHHSGKYISHAFIAGLCIGGCLLLRSIGIVFALTIGLQYMLRRDLKRLTHFAVGVLILYLPWFVYSTKNGGGSFRAYATAFKDDYYPYAPFDNLYGLLDGLSRQLLLPFSTTNTGIKIISQLHSSRATLCIGICLAIFVLLGCVRLFKNHQGMVAGFLLYMVTVIVCPWDPNRYAVPMLPLAAILAFEGIRFIKSGISSGAAWTKFSTVLLVAVLTQSILVDLMWMKNIVVFQHYAGKVSAKQWADTDTACKWLENNTTNNTLVISTYPYAVYLFANRKTLSQPPSVDAMEKLLRAPVDNREVQTTDLNGDRPIYVLATRRVHAMARRHGMEFGLSTVDQFIQAHPHSLAEVWHNNDNDIRIYKYQPNQAVADREQNFCSTFQANKHK